MSITTGEAGVPVGTAPSARVSREERPTQADRRARSRTALLEAAARGLSRYGYSKLNLEEVASEAGYTRGALYHQFANKEELALAVVEWVKRTWYAQMAPLFSGRDDPAKALMSVARAHAIYCRRDIARVMMTLRVEFSGRDHPVGRSVAEAVDRILDDTARLITAGRRKGTIPPGAPPRVLALALMGALEGAVISLAGQEPYDEQLAEQVVSSLLGLPPSASSG